MCASRLLARGYGSFGAPTVRNRTFRGRSRCYASSVLLEVVDRFRPVVLQEPRERPVGEELPAGLAPRAVVALVFRIDDPLHRRAANGAGQLEAPVHGHGRMERGHLRRKSTAGFGAELVGPL